VTAESDTALARDCARAICEAFGDYNTEFRRVTQRARTRFETRDWAGAREDAVERIDLYERYVQHMVGWLKEQLGDRQTERDLWILIKEDFSNEIRYYLDLEFTKTYFSSITRRIFATVGVDPDVEFVALDMEPIAGIRQPIALNVYENRGSLWQACKQLLEDFAFDVPWADLTRCVSSITDAVSSHWADLGGQWRLKRVEFMRPVFYQNTRAYLVGRALGEEGEIEPLIIALRHDEAGVAVDAVITSREDTSVLFGFTRSYFHADLETVHDAVVFLRSIMPHKPLAELFTVLGRAKQGKTERYRSFFRHLGNSSDLFVHAPGDKGMVMAVFTLPSYDIVFKIIRDKFAYPKTVARRDVLAKYQLVFKHDRAGRLVDAQEFRMLRFPRSRFAPELLEELLTETASTCRIEDDHLVIDHMYIERRLAPLNLFLRDAPAEQAAEAIVDYGQSIRDLACSNIFPGDLLLKNFGVTRNGRVIFYDYDELCLVTECNFREMPQARTLEEEMQAEAWFYVGENDVFPEQFGDFLGLEPDHLALFRDHHQDLLNASYWRDLKNRHEAGEIIEVLPYRRSLSASIS
jgi:isocitrate dehydrogenase kinase/phosphatase